MCFISFVETYPAIPLCRGIWKSLITIKHTTNTPGILLQQRQVVCGACLHPEQGNDKYLRRSELDTTSQLWEVSKLETHCKWPNDHCQLQVTIPPSRYEMRATPLPRSMSLTSQRQHSPQFRICGDSMVAGNSTFP